MLELARESDWDAVNRLSVQIHDLHAAWRPDIYYHHEAPYPKEAFLADIQNRMVYVAKPNGTVVGYTVLSIQHKGGPGTCEKRIMRIDSICVEELLRRQGIGKAMMTDIRALAAAFECAELVLGVHPENQDAVAFYRECGFQIRTIHMDRKL